jgi:predicted TIM-barrel fold metal-dependent hydrolase
MLAFDRRHFLTGVAGLGLGRFAAPTVFAQAVAAAKTRAIDIHHHFAPPAWIAAVKGRPLLQPANTSWTVEKSIEDLDRAGSAAAVISITNPGLWFGDNQATNRLVRACNDYGATLVQRYPTRFGLFAAMPLPDVDGTLKEIAYAYDVLNVDGIGLFTSYGDQWLGNAAFDPVMAELNRRKAIVHVHPTAANCCRNLAYGTAPGSIEYGTDTTRAVVSVTFGGTTTRYRDITFIWSHAGGSVPFFAGRIDGASATAKNRMPAGFINEAKKFYYDTAGAANRGAIASLLELVSSSHILFGTDYPPGGTNEAIRKAVAELGFFNDESLRAIERDNALRLLPRLKAAGI